MTTPIKPDWLKKKSLEKLMLEWFAENPEGVYHVSDIGAAFSGWAWPTVRNILTELHNTGWVMRTAPRYWSIAKMTYRVLADVDDKTRDYSIITDTRERAIVLANSFAKNFINVRVQVGAKVFQFNQLEELP